MRNIKILMVCLGNICRSPLASRNFTTQKSKKMLLSILLEQLLITLEESPDPRSILVAKEKGIDISNYKARKFIKEGF